jgi:hypothetical protein
VSESFRALLFLPLMAVLLFFSAPAARREALGVLTHLERSPAERFAVRTTGFGPLVRAVASRVPPDEPILIQAPTGAAPLHSDLVIHYWLYPRKIYSVESLRLAGEDVRQFARAHGILWGYREGRLENLGGPAPPPTRSELPCSLHSGTPLRVGVGILLALAHFLLVGALIVSGVGRGRLVLSRIEGVALSYLVGTGAVGVWTILCFTTGIGVRLSTVSLSLLLAFAFFAFRSRGRRKRSRSSPNSRSDSSEEGGPAGRGSRRRGLSPFGRTEGIAALVALLLVGLLTLRALAMPMGGYDARYQWAHKAHVMLHEASIWGSGFQDPQSLNGHPRYPLLIPSVEAVVFLYAGGFNDQYVTLLFPLFLGALLALLCSGLEALGRRRGRGLAVLALLLVPAYWGYGIARDGAAAFSGYPDLPLSAFATAAMVYLLRARVRPSAHLYLISALLILFCGLTKSEGKVHALVFIALALAFLAAGRSARAELRSALPAFGAVACLLALYELAVVQPTPPGPIPDDYSELVRWERITGDLGRLASIVPMLAREYFLSVRLGFPGLLLAAAALFFLRRGAGAQALLPACYVGLMLGLYSGPYLVLPEEIWEKNYIWSAGRLMLQLVPMTFLAASMLVLPCRPPAAAVSDHRESRSAEPGDSSASPGCA